MNRLDRPGIFKARPVSWKVQTSTKSKSVGLNFEFEILAQLADGVDGNGEKISVWESWEGYDPVGVYGTIWVIGKEGKPNQNGIEQLVKSLGWDGDLRSVLGPVPDVVCQIQVKEEVFEGNTQLKVAWINPEDFVPSPGGASSDEVTQLSTQFGSLLRAAAAGAKRASPSKPAAPAPKAQAPAPPPAAPASARPAATATLPDPVGGAPLTWSRKEAIDRLGAAPDAKIQTAINDAGLSGVVKTRTQVAGLDDEALKRFDDALFNIDCPF